MTENHSQKTSRKKFLFWSVALLVPLGILNIFSRVKKQDPRFVTMLDQNGNLVKVDMANIPKKAQSVTDAEIHNWMKPPSKKLVDDKRKQF